MNGLLINYFFSAVENLKLFLVFDFVVSALLIITGNMSLMDYFPILSTLILASLIVATGRKLESCKWNKYMLTFPLTRKKIVQGQYISHLLAVLISSIWVSITIGLAVLIHGNIFFYFGFRDALGQVMIGVVMGILLGAYVLPMVFFWGAGRMEAILAIGLSLDGITVLGITWVINIIVGKNNVTDLNFYLSLAIILLFSLLVIWGSYLLSICIFKRKEY